MSGMAILYMLIPLAVLLGGGFLVVFLKATDSGQFDDLETPAVKLLIEEKGNERTSTRNNQLR